MITGSIGSFHTLKTSVPHRSVFQVAPTPPHAANRGKKNFTEKEGSTGNNVNHPFLDSMSGPLHFFIFPLASGTCPHISPASIIWTYALYMSRMYTLKDTLRGPDSAVWTAPIYRTLCDCHVFHVFAVSDGSHIAKLYVKPSHDDGNKMEKYLKSNM